VTKDLQDLVLAPAPPTPPGEVRMVAACRSRPLRSRDLLDGEGRLLIDHGGQWYLLRSLPGGRLILTGWRPQVPAAPHPAR
jgi:hemin uptake protein HemP